jgi:hypothetical protein
MGYEDVEGGSGKGGSGVCLATRAGGLARAVGELLEGGDAVVELQAHIEEGTCARGNKGTKRRHPSTHTLCARTGRGSKYSAAEHAGVIGPDAAAAAPTVATFELVLLATGSGRVQ